MLIHAAIIAVSFGLIVIMSSPEHTTAPKRSQAIDNFRKDCAELHKKISASASMPELFIASEILANIKKRYKKDIPWVEYSKATSELWAMIHNTRFLITHTKYLP